MIAALFASEVMRKHVWLVSFVQPEHGFTFFKFQETMEALAALQGIKMIIYTSSTSSYNIYKMCSGYSLDEVEGKKG